MIILIGGKRECIVLVIIDFVVFWWLVMVIFFNFGFIVVNNKVSFIVFCLIMVVRGKLMIVEGLIIGIVLIIWFLFFRILINGIYFLSFG